MKKTSLILAFSVMLITAACTNADTANTVSDSTKTVVDTNLTPSTYSLPADSIANTKQKDSIK